MWRDLPANVKKDSVRSYYNNINNKVRVLLLIRFFDICITILLLIALYPFLLLFMILIKLDSNGSVFFRQVRVTQYGKHFRIYKFRTMVHNAEVIGSQVTTQKDIRVTRLGRILRKYRLDELPQLFNILAGDMTYVGTRPEVPKYVNQYSDEMFATLLLPAGVTSEASIYYKDEEQLLEDKKNVDMLYVYKVLPAKMKYNLEGIKKFSFFYYIQIISKTLLAVIKQ